MENFTQEENPIEKHQEQTLQLTEVLRSHLYESAKWAKIIAVIGLVAGVGLALLGLFGAVLGASFLKQFSGNEMSMASAFLGIYVVVGLFVIIISWKLYQFAKQSKSGILYMEQYTLEAGLNNLRQYFKINAVLQLIAVVFYALIFVVAVMGGVVGTMLK